MASITTSGDVPVFCLTYNARLHLLVCCDILWLPNLSSNYLIRLPYKFGFFFLLLPSYPRKRLSVPRLLSSSTLSLGSNYFSRLRWTGLSKALFFFRCCWVGWLTLAISCKSDSRTLCQCTQELMACIFSAKSTLEGTSAHSVDSESL